MSQETVGQDDVEIRSSEFRDELPFDDAEAEARERSEVSVHQAAETPEPAEQVESAGERSRSGTDVDASSDHDLETSITQANARIDQLTRDIQARNAPTPPEHDPEVEYWADPVAATQRMKDEILTELDRRETLGRINYSEQRALERYTDFTEKRDAFAVAARQDPHLVREMTQADDPAEFAYRFGQALQDAQECGGDFEAWKERERAQLRAQVEAERRSVRRPAHATPRVRDASAVVRRRTMKEIVG